MEGVAEEEEVDDQLLWNLQILSEVRMYLFYFFIFSLFSDILGIRALAKQGAIVW